MEQLEPAELKRKFKDVLRAYWRQHKGHYESQDTEHPEVAATIAQSIFQLYWDKPIYEPLRGEKDEIIAYFIKHIQLSKTREGQSNNPSLRSSLAFGVSAKNQERLLNDVDKTIQGIRMVASVESDPEPINCMLIRDNKSPYLVTCDDSIVMKGFLNVYALIISTDLITDVLSLFFPKDIKEFSNFGSSKQFFDHSSNSKCKNSRVLCNDDLRKWACQNIPVEEHSHCLILEEIGSALSNEKKLNKEITNSLFDQYGIVALSVKKLNYPDRDNRYAKILVSSNECIQLAGRSLRIASSGQKLKMFTIVEKNTSPQPLYSNPKKRKSNEISNGPESNLHSNTQSKSFNDAFESFQKLETNTYVVDSILQQRWVNNNVQYQLRLKGERQTIKVWVLDEKIYSEFEANRRNKNIYNSISKCSWGENFDWQDQVGSIDKVLGVKKIDQELMMYVKWNKSNLCSFVPSKIVKMIAPQQLIQFYEERISFSES